MVGELPVEAVQSLPDARAEDVAVGVRYQWIEAFVRNGVLAVDVPGADVEAARELASDAKFVEEAGFPIEWERDVSAGLAQGQGVEAVPIRPVEVELKIPVWRWAEGVAANDRLRKIVFEAGIVFVSERRDFHRAKRRRGGEARDANARMAAG